MNYATIKYYDIANGPGVRTSVFVSGCRHHCPGCFNEVAWDFGYGQPFDKPVRNEVFASCKPDYITGLSLLGGEPMEPENQRELVTFVQNFKALYPKKTVWCYSGYTWEQLTGKVPCHARCEVTDELLRLLDVLVDGRFVEAEYDISLRFRGSRTASAGCSQVPRRRGSRCGGRTKKSVLHPYDGMINKKRRSSTTSLSARGRSAPFLILCFPPHPQWPAGRPCHSGRLSFSPTPVMFKNSSMLRGLLWTISRRVASLNTM